MSGERREIRDERGCSKGVMKIHTDNVSRVLYSTDASAYRERPYGVCFPEKVDDIVSVIRTASQMGLSVIPRCAGTSLAGQVVGSGIVADVSLYMNKIREINPDGKWVRTEPGVVLDELNKELAGYGLFFGPETSTSNRCCMGGMVGNNSCGSHSLVYGSTRDHLLEAKVVLGDGSLAVFSEERAAEIFGLLAGGKEPVTLEEKIYRQLYEMAGDDALLEKINKEFPDKEVKRRNCGYALDLLLNDIRFRQDGRNFNGDAGRAPNLCTILAGSEGTLAFVYELKLNLLPLPPEEKMLLCAHCSSLPDVFRANLIALEHSPEAVELMDSNILELSKGNLSQQKNRFFVKGEPAAILMIEIAADTAEKLESRAVSLEESLMQSALVYHCSKVYGKDISKVWELRKSGLGLLSGMKGDSKPVSVIEDTAVAPSRLPAYMADFAGMLDSLGLNCVYHAHIGTGELHLRPILNIKNPHERKLFREVAYRTALLVKKHKGSLSGEHGDGRLRGEFIPVMYGEEIYGLFKKIKRLWDPHGVFNVGKITDTPPMDTGLRYEAEQEYAVTDISTYFDFDDVKGLFCAVEQCNGSGDCRKSARFAGVLCSAYKADPQERSSTRARANILREILTRGTLDGGREKGTDLFRNDEVYRILDSCLSCKACKSECPSNVDMTRLKAEFLQHRYESRGRFSGKGVLPFWGGVPFRSFMVAHMCCIQRIGSAVTPLYNFFAEWNFSSGILKRILKFSSQRHLPALSRKTLRKLAGQYSRKCNGAASRRVYLFADEFTGYTEAELGLTFIKLLDRLGYEVIIPRHYESGRAALSKGLLKYARKIAVKNVLALKDIITGQTPLVGIEPSCILSFRDEYPSLVAGAVKAGEVPGYSAGDYNSLSKQAAELGKNCLLYDEFIVREIEAGRITGDMFSDASARVWLHGHCHQKAFIGIDLTARMLRLPVNYKVNVIPSGCCGMAGSFGYEREHYRTSMEIGNQILFPAVREAVLKRREAPDDTYIISAPGTSCRQQILDGTGERALHPLVVLWNALK